MLSKRVYDILTIAFIVLVILSTVIMSLFMPSPLEQFQEGGAEAVKTSMTLRNIPGYILVVIYWIFIMILSVQLYTLKKLSLIELILIILLVPVAFIFYLLTLRGKINKNISS